jgi:hypothetical protein
MIDEAEKAWEEWASAPVEQGFPVQVDYRRAFLAGRASRDAEVAAQQQRIRELELREAEIRVEAFMTESDSYRERIAARDAVIERVREWAENPADGVHENRVIDFMRLHDVLDAAPESLLAEVKAQALEEFATLQDTLMRVHDYVMDDDDWDEHYRCTASLRAGAANYRKGAGQ